jgi:hypothetical protein
MGMDTHVNTSGLPAGMYTIAVQLDNQPVQAKKVLINR